MAKCFRPAKPKKGVHMKGILLAGGSGSRLYPSTLGTSKQLLPIYDKPLLYYPLSVLMLTGIQEILLITTPHEQNAFRRLLGDGQQLGLELSYATQPSPNGIAEAFLIGRDFIGSQSVALALGDNIFYGQGLQQMLRDAAGSVSGATVFGYRVRDPSRYGVVEFDEHDQVVGLTEKPAIPASHYAVTGLYFYDNQVCDIASSLEPSSRGELEITDVNLTYLERNQLRVRRLGRGIAWLDTGTHASMFHATNFIEAIQQRQGLMVACLEEIACRMGFIDREQLARIAENLKDTDYGVYLQGLLRDEL